MQNFPWILQNSKLKIVWKFREITRTKISQPPYVLVEWGGWGASRYSPGAPSALTQIVHYSSSYYTVFHSVIYNSVASTYTAERSKQGSKRINSSTKTIHLAHLQYISYIIYLCCADFITFNTLYCPWQLGI